MQETSLSLFRQRGAALLLMMLVLLVAATAVLVSRLGTTEMRVRQIATTQDALASARAALLHYAAIRPDQSLGSPVALPCPDIDDSAGLDEGDAHTNTCGSSGETVMGRVPWRTLGIRPPVDASGACLWYMVSGSVKEAGTATAAMINPDSNGQLQLWGIENGAIIAGAVPADRPVALLLAPMAAHPGQNRPAAGNRQCSANFTAADYLDVEVNTGIANDSLSGVADALDTLAVAAGRLEDHNDRVAMITRADLETATLQRADFLVRMRALGLAATACLADYARKNIGGADDQRMPWPTPLQLPDYRLDSAYDDVNSATFSGRLPDVVDDSSGLTGNPTALVLSGCDAAAVPAWSVQMHRQWQNWKDHFFYVVADSYAPTATVPSACIGCISVNGTGQYAAVVLFANSRLDALAQVRDAPPTDADTRNDIGNYLEAANAAGFPHAGGALDLSSQAADTSFNDLLFCIDESLVVSEC